MLRSTAACLLQSCCPKQDLPLRHPLAQPALVNECLSTAIVPSIQCKAAHVPSSGMQFPQSCSKRGHALVLQDSVR